MTGRRIIDQPQAGYFKVRLVKGGPWVPLLISQGKLDDDRHPTLEAMLGVAGDGVIGHGWIDPLALCNGAHVIVRADYDRMIKRIHGALWAQQWDAPELNPYEPVKLDMTLLQGGKQ